MKFHTILLLFLTLISSSCSKETDVIMLLNKNIAHLEINKTLFLEVTTNIPTNQEVQWQSTNEEIVKVTKGIVTAVGEGKAEIIASIGNSSAICVVFVTQEGGVYYGEYELVWSDEFEGNTLDTETWNIEQGGGGWGNQEKQHYTDRADNLRVEDGYLIIEAKKEDYERNNYTSARITTKNKQDFLYGKIEARISLPKGGGTWPAFWMMGYGNWPFCGEIDIMEHIGNSPNKIIHALHTQDKNGMKGTNWYNQQTISDIEENFHVYGIEWLQNYQFGRDAIRFYIDDKVSTTQFQAQSEENLASWPFAKNFYIIMNLALGGTLGGSINENIFNDPANNPVLMKVDWVRVYQKKL